MSELQRIDEALAAATDRLRPVSESPRLDAELLLARALDVERSYLFAHPEDSMDEAATARFEEALQLRAGQMPMAYITGQKEFWSLPLMVTPDTLVPRPESELIVQIVLEMIDEESTAQIADLGTGSGAIAVAIARERPCASLVATDIDPAAIAVARQNARQLEIGNIEFVVGDWTGPIADRLFDIVVCNPPYVREDDPALAELEHEPQRALVSGKDGLDDIRRLADECRDILRADGAFLVEHGADQEQAVAGVFAASGWQVQDCRRDLGARPRVTIARS